MSRYQVIRGELPDGEEGYGPHGGARELVDYKGPEVLIEGPWGTGKTRAVLEKLHAFAAQCPGCRILVVRKTRASLTDSVLVTFEDKVLSERDRINLETEDASRAYRREYRYPNGSAIVLGGMDKATRILSSDYDVIFFAEAIEGTEEDAEMLAGRLRHGVVPYQQLIYDCNPGPPSHWLNQRAERGLTHRILSRHADNPTLTPEYLERLSRLSGVRRDRYFLGRWAAAEGAVYPEWDAAVHHVYRALPSRDWPRHWVVDFGFVHPFVWQEWAEDPDGRLVMTTEIYHTKRIVEDHARAIREASDFQPTVIICDHDAENRATLERHLGMVTRPAFKSVSPGIQAVQARMQPGADGKPRLTIMRDSLKVKDPMLVEPDEGPPLPWSTAQEVESYIWDAKKDAPVKRNDHGVDCMRYLVAHVDQIHLRSTGKVYHKTAEGLNTTIMGDYTELEL